MSVSKLDRRSFLKLGTLSILACKSFPTLAGASPSNAFAAARTRSLSFHNLHTAEKLQTQYWENGQYIPESMASINHILRDYRNNEICEIAPGLLDALCEVRMLLETEQPLELISGYRSPVTNAKLRNEGHGVATNSLHMKGMAADVRIPGRSLENLRRAALSLKAGGVGYYPSQFVHIDVGRVRTW
jgi:uncharacterized protein YcbK (DUF882 family)